MFPESLVDRGVGGAVVDPRKEKKNCNSANGRWNPLQSSGQISIKFFESRTFRSKAGHLASLITLCSPPTHFWCLSV